MLEEYNRKNKGKTDITNFPGLVQALHYNVTELSYRCIDLNDVVMQVFFVNDKIVACGYGL